jgi:hypothetical protein
MVGELNGSPLLCSFHSIGPRFSQQHVKYSFLCLNNSFHTSSAFDARYGLEGMKLNKGQRIFSVTVS